MWRKISGAMSAKPEVGTMVMMSLFSYAQVRHLYESEGFWDPSLVGKDPLECIPSEKAAGLSAGG